MKDTPIKCLKLLSVMADDDEILYEELFVGHCQYLSDALDAESVFPTTVSQLHTLTNGHRYVAICYLRGKYDQPLFDNYDYHLLVDDEEGTMLVTRLVTMNPSDAAESDGSFHSFHSYDTIEGTEDEDYTAKKTNEANNAENRAEQADSTIDTSYDTNDTNGTNETNEPYLVLYTSSALNDYRDAHAGSRPAAEWLGEMASLPPGRPFHYWYARQGNQICLVRDSGVFFGHAEEAGRMLVMDTYAAMAVVQLPLPLLPIRLDAYRSLVNGLCGRVAMDDAFREETFAAKSRLTAEIKREIKELLDPVSKLMKENLTFSWEELWARILSDSVIATQLTNTSRTKFKAYNQPLLATLVCQLQHRGIIKEYEAKALAMQLGFNEDDSFRHFLGQMPKKVQIRKALDDILAGFRI